MATEALVAPARITRSEEKGEPMAELKPCPFCGSADVGVGIELPQFGQELKRFVVCNCCGSRTASYRKEDVAVGIWNNCTEPERPKGRWVWDEMFSDYTCSVCHNWDLKTPNFCSNCGADMRGESE